MISRMSSFTLSNDKKDKKLKPKPSIRKYIDSNLMFKEETIPLLKSNPKLRVEAIKWIIKQKEKTKTQVRVSNPK